MKLRAKRTIILLFTAMLIVFFLGLRIEKHNFSGEEVLSIYGHDIGGYCRNTEPPLKLERWGAYSVLSPVARYKYIFIVVTLLMGLALAMNGKK